MEIINGGGRRYYDKIVMIMRRICTFMIIATLLTLGCTAQDCPQCVLKKFYNQYLELSCPPHGEYPNHEEVQRLLKQHLTPKLYSAWEASHDAESDDWIDYDMFIQGQDCWPGIHIKDIVQIKGTQWYEIIVTQPDMESPDRRVFFHLEPIDKQWRIGCIDDGHNRLGNAPEDEDKALKSNPDYQN